MNKSTLVSSSVQKRNSLKPAVNTSPTNVKLPIRLSSDTNIPRSSSVKNLGYTKPSTEDNSPLSDCSGESSPFRVQRLPGAQERRSKFHTVNDHVFQHVDFHTLPLNYGSPSMTKDTFEFLAHMKDSESAVVIRDLYESQSYSIEGRDPKEVDNLALDFARLLEYCLDHMLSALQIGDRIIWQTRVLNLIQAVYQAEFGDICMKHVKERINALLERFPIISENESEVKKQAGLGDLGITVVQDAKLSNYMAKLKMGKYQRTKADEEFEAMNGQVATPSELTALHEIFEYVEKIQEDFEKDIKEILEEKGGESFKCNIKGFERAAYKMSGYAAKKPRPSFNYLFDLIRCRAVYHDIADIKKMIKAIAKKYKIVSFKDKINTPLKNVTINIVYQEVIAEIQLVCGTVALEYHSHRLYEILRCESMAEIYDVARGWGDYNFDTFKPCNFWILPTKNLEPQSMYSIQGSRSHPVLKSIEHGVVNEDAINMDCEDNPRSACWQNIQQLVCQYDDYHIQNVSLTGIQVVGNYEIEKHIIPNDDLVQNIKGTYTFEGIKSLVFITKKGKKISFGKTEGDKEFDMKIPKHMVVLGLYYAWNEAGVQSIACWFGEAPLLSNVQAIPNPQDALPDVGLRCRCETCRYQLYWEWNDKKDRQCNLCRVKIDKNAGYADCIRSSNPICSCCYSKMEGAKELPNILKLKCPKGTLYKWRFKTLEGFKCSECSTKYDDNTGFFMNGDTTSKICSGCYMKKGKIQERVYYDTFPVVQIDKPCGKCNKGLIWSWNAKLLGHISDEFECKDCACVYPVTAGCYYCKSCDYDVCSSCFYSSEDTYVPKMPNFLRKKCNFFHFLTWQFSNKAPWRCNLCDVTYPLGAGCYTCPESDCEAYKECAACYLQRYLNFRYDELNLTILTPERIDQILRLGRFKADLKCKYCDDVCYWIWNTKIIPGHQNKANFICSNHKEEVPHNYGAFHCFKCNHDLCTQCYYVDMKKLTPSIPSDHTKCPKGNSLLFKFGFADKWTCSQCNSVSPDQQAGFICATAKCGCNGIQLCPGCYIASDIKISGGIQCNNCDAGYNWVWDLRDINKQYEKGYPCAVCERHICKNEGGFHCDNGCSNDICAHCMEKKGAGKPIVFPSKAKCAGNLPMTWLSRSTSTWHCLLCCSKMPQEAGGFSCHNSKCKCKAAQICSSCYGLNYLEK